MFVGYLDPRSTRESFIAGGWFRTGDLARFDGEHLTIVDRLKDVIIRGGENISAQEVEALLVTHAGVAEAACVAAPDPVMGEEVCAFVIAAGDAAPTLEELRAHLVDAGPGALQAAVAPRAAARAAAYRERQGAEGAAARRARAAAR